MGAGDAKRRRRERARERYIIQYLVSTRLCTLFTFIHHQVPNVADTLLGLNNGWINMRHEIGCHLGTTTRVTSCENK